MSPSEWNSIVPLLITAMAALLSGGGVVALIQYFANKPVNIAKAKRENVASEISVGQAWAEYASTMQKQYNKIQEQYHQMQDMYDELKAKHEELIALKEKEINELKHKIVILEDEIVVYKEKLQTL